MNHISPHWKSIPKKLIALICSVCLLLPFGTMGVALADSAEPSLPVWNGGVAESFNGSGVESDPYRISTAEELALLAQLVRSGNSFSGTYFLLTNHLRLNNTENYAQWDSAPPRRLWIPIGGYSTVTVQSEEAFRQIADTEGLYLRTEDGYQPTGTYTPGVIYYRLTAFCGIFDGDGHTISGLYCNDQEVLAGLFGACRNATIRNLTLTDAYVAGGTNAGLLAGMLYSTDHLLVDNCTVQGTLHAQSDIGGLAGYGEAIGVGNLTINACSFSGTVSGKDTVGGILGKTGLGSGSVILSANTTDGNLTATQNAGGIVGTLAGEADQILACKNNTAIHGETNIGGIAGLLSPSSGVSTVSDCQNGGVLLADRSVGGIVGAIQASGMESSTELLSCRNVGEVYGNTAVGGIIGSCSIAGEENSVNVLNAKNSAAVGSFSRAGGIVGDVAVKTGALSIEGCENYGNIAAADCYAGGIIGYGEVAARLELYRTSVRAAISAENSYAGGIAGSLSADSGSILVELSAVGGTVKASAGIAGGTVGSLSSRGAASAAEIRNCMSGSILTAAQAAGGIVGQLSADNGQVSISTSLFCGGIVTGSQHPAGIAASVGGISKDGAAQITGCYFNQNAASAAIRQENSEGNAICTDTVGLTEEALRDTRQLSALDFTIWAADAEGKHFPLPRELPFVWEDYEYTVTQNGAILLAYLGRSDIARIPDKLGGVSVTTVAESAFWQNQVVRVVMPNSITAIGEAAFAGCRDLERVTLSESLISVGARAFSECTSLSELRCAKPLGTLVIGSENAPFQSLSIIKPVTVQVTHTYEDGTVAGKTTSLSCYVGDYYRIQALEITGYKADESVLSGICNGAARIAVVYRIGTYRLTIRYLYPDGSEAFPSYEGDLQFGETFSVSTPVLDGYKPDRSILEGTMEGEDTQLTVYFTEVFENEQSAGEHTLQIVLLILSGLVLVCCLVYFIYRYRSSAEHGEQDD